MNTTPPALALSHVPPSQTASEHTDHGPDTRGRASLRALSLVRAALERVQGVSRVRHHRTGEWTVDVRVLDPRATCDEIAYRVQGARLALRETGWRGETDGRLTDTQRTRLGPANPAPPQPSTKRAALPGGPRREPMHVNPNIPPRFATSSGRACLVHVTDGEHESPVCVCYGSEEPDGDAAMALRIAALLNFAEGVPTEELRGLRLRFVVDVRGRVLEVIQDDDGARDLLVALGARGGYHTGGGGVAEAPGDGAHCAPSVRRCSEPRERLVSGPLRSPSRDLVRLVCPSCEDEIRVAADEIRPECKRCAVLLSEPGLCPRAHDFAIERLTIKQKGRDPRTLYPVPGGFVEYAS